MIPRCPSIMMLYVKLFPQVCMLFHLPACSRYAKSSVFCFWKSWTGMGLGAGMAEGALTQIYNGICDGRERAFNHT